MRDHGQQAAVGAVPPRITPIDQVPRPLPAHGVGDWLRADMDPDDPGSQGYSPTETRHPEPPVVRSALGVDAITQLDHDVLQRARRLNGWTKAAALHARQRYGEDTLCDECGVDWPCRTATALGLVP